MRFMNMVKSVEGAGGPPPKALIDAINALGVEAAKQGVLVEAGGLAPTAMGGRVTVSSGKVTVLDGPFSESKEVIGGYAVYDLRSKAEALEWARRFMELHRELWPGWEGEAEVRQVFGPGDFSK
jgi:hypothetical protein